MKLTKFLAAGVCIAGLSSGASAADSATAELKGPDGSPRGSVTLRQTPNGVVLAADLHDLPAGVHGFHIHETGRCEPDFGAAGGHFAGAGDAHGFMVEGGPHAGDMANIHVPTEGSLVVEAFNSRISLDETADNTVLDQDGSAIVVHSGADDYESQPSGDSGDHIACGVITAASGG